MDALQIAQAYENIRDKPDFQRFLIVARSSRKFGFPLVATHDSSVSLDKKISLAARLLFEIAMDAPDTFYNELPDDLVLDDDSSLYHDARSLVVNGEAHMAALNKRFSQEIEAPQRHNLAFIPGFLLGIGFGIVIGSVMIASIIT